LLPPVPFPQVTASRNEETIAASTPTSDASIPRIGGMAEVIPSFVAGDVLDGRFCIVREGLSIGRVEGVV